MKKSIKRAVALVMSLSMLASVSAVAVSAEETASSTAVMYNAAIEVAAAELGCEADSATVMDAIVALDDEALAAFDAAMVEAVEGEVVAAAAAAVVDAAKAAVAEEGIAAVAVVDDFTATMEYAGLEASLNAVSNKVAEINAQILDLATDGAVVAVCTPSGKLPTVTPEIIISEGTAAVAAAFDEALAAAPVSGVAAATLAGDVIVDGKLTAADLVATKQIVIEKPAATTAEGVANADFNGNGDISVTDVMGLKKALLG